MENVIKDRLTMLAALGAGVVVGVSGIYLYYKSNSKIIRELHQINRTIDRLRCEIETLRMNSPTSETAPPPVLSKPKPSRAKKKESYASSNYCSSDDEFFDISDNEQQDDHPPTTVTTESPEQLNSILRNRPSSPNHSRSSLHQQNSVLSPKNSKLYLYESLDELLDNGPLSQTSYARIHGLKEEHKDDPEFLWRLAKATHLMAVKAKNDNRMEERKKLIFEAYEYAKAALEFDDTNAEVHKWYAITLGSLSDYLSIQEKIDNGIKFRFHVEKALELSPDDATLYYMLGRWCYEVASLTFVERKIASSLYGNMPEATIGEAIEYLLKANELKPDWRENLLYLAKAYFNDRQPAEGMKCVDMALSLEPEEGEMEDVSVSQELDQLRDKYQNYR